MSLCALGIDLGLSGARAAVVDETGRLLGSGRVAGGPWRQASGIAECRPEDWFEQAVGAARLALEQAGRPAIAAIAAGALGPCPVLLDEALDPLAPSPLFSLDRRAEATRRRLIEKHRLAPEQLGPDHALARLAWWQETAPAMTARAAWTVDAAGFLVARLTGTPVMDPITREDYTAPGLASPVPLPALIPGDAIAGALSAAAAERLGLEAGTPVAAGSYDSYVDIAGSGAGNPGDGCIVLGSTLILGRAVSSPRAAPGLRCQPRIGGGWFLGGWTSTAGSLLDWSRTAFGAEEEPTSDMDLMPGSGGLLVLPYFAGERAPIWDPAARGAILGTTLATTRPELRRAMLDGVVLSALDIALRLPAGTGGGWRLCGGGARNAALAQGLADALGQPLAVLAHPGEAIAPALLAFAAIGRRIPPRIARMLTPDAGRRARYEALHAIYRGLYPALARSMHDLGRLAENKEKEGR